jgi:hypothetical protein
MKSRLISVAIIVIAWMALDVGFHGIWLMGEYEATAGLWRPMDQMKNGVMNISTIATALFFVLIFCQLVSDKSLQKGVKLGVLVGLITGTGSALISYATMPITTTIALGWFLANVTKYTVAGVITGYFVKTDLK